VKIPWIFGYTSVDIFNGNGNNSMDIVDISFLSY
jgi:hypothetical protein